MKIHGFLRNARINMLLLTALVCLTAFGAAAQSSKERESDDNEGPRLLMVIFSVPADASRRMSSQTVVWKSYVASLQKRKVADLGVINEDSINEGADRARAFEIARDQSKYTVWIQFGAMVEGDGDRKQTVDAERMVAKYIVFAPESNEIVGQGEIEQERVPDSMYSTQNNEKPVRDNSGRVINAKTAVRLPDGSSSLGGNKFMDLDALKRVGEAVADRVLGAVKKHQKKRSE